MYTCEINTESKTPQYTIILEEFDVKDFKLKRCYQSRRRLSSLACSSSSAFVLAFSLPAVGSDPLAVGTSPN